MGKTVVIEQDKLNVLKENLNEFMVDKSSNFANRDAVWFIVYKGDLLFFDYKNKTLLDDFMHRHEDELSSTVYDYERNKFYFERNFDGFVDYLGSLAPYLITGYISNGKDAYINKNENYDVLNSNEMYQLVKKMPNTTFYFDGKIVDREEILNNKGKGIPSVWYHGTTFEYALKILGKGLRPQPSNSLYKIQHDKTVFLSSNFRQAKWYANYKSRQRGGMWTNKPCVLEIDGNRIDTNKIVYDYDVYFSHSINKDDSVYNEKLKERGMTYDNKSETIKKPTDPRKYMKVGYRGIIMPNAVTNAYVVSYDGDNKMTPKEFMEYINETYLSSKKEMNESSTFENSSVVKLWHGTDVQSIVKILKTNTICAKDGVRHGETEGMNWFSLEKSFSFYRGVLFSISVPSSEFAEKFRMMNSSQVVTVDSRLDISSYDIKIESFCEFTRDALNRYYDLLVDKGERYPVESIRDNIFYEWCEKTNHEEMYMNVSDYDFGLVLSNIIGKDKVMKEGFVEESVNEAAPEVDEYEIGQESDNPPVGGNYCHINEGANFDSSEIGAVNYSWDFDEDEYQEWLVDAEYEKNQESLMEYINDCVTFELEYLDNETYHTCGCDNVDYETLEDMFGSKMQKEILDTCMSDGSGSFETVFLFSDDDVDVNDPDSINNAAMSLMRHGEYFKGCRGFILTNGVVVYTEWEHNEITRLPNVKDKFDFIRMGNIRVLSQSIDIGAKPTSEQRDVLRQVIASYAEEELYLDIYEGKSCIGVKYVHPNWRFVMGEIDRYYSEGIKPQGNEFYESKKAQIVENKYDDLFNKTYNDLQNFIAQCGKKYGTSLWHNTSWMKYKHPEIKVDENDFKIYDALEKKYLEVVKLWNKEDEKEEEEKRSQRPTEDYDIISLAIEEFGLTSNLNQAGYILPDGKLLNFGASYGGSRDIDHRNIKSVYDNNGIKIWSDEYRYNYVVDFMNHGAIRCCVNGGLLDMTQEPTSEQYSVIRNFVRNSGDVDVDFTDDVGNVLHSASYWDAKPQQVVGDIYKYYNDGIKPQGTAQYESRKVGLNESTFEEWYGNSLLKDENGEPLKMYHGSDYEFDSFDKKYIGQHGMYEGFGFNFTPFRSRAEGYGKDNVIEAYLKVEHPLLSNKNEMTVSKIAKILAEVDEGKEANETIVRAIVPPRYNEKCDANFYRRALPIAARQLYQYSIENEYGDAGVYSDICMNASNEDKYRIIEVFEKFGYDSVIFHDDMGRITTVTVFEPNQIKRVGNKTYNGDSSNMNEGVKSVIMKEEQVLKLKENFEDEVESSEIDLSSFKKKNDLAPNIWDDEDTLNSKVRLRLLDVADDFWNFVELSWVKPKGIILTGSICNYNWSHYSDIDLHLVVDFKEVDEKTEFVRDYFDSKKNEWNESHSGLKIYDFNIEVYVQDVNDDMESSGVYDLEENKWIEKPSSSSIKPIGLEKYDIKDKAAEIMTIVDNMYDDLNSTDDSHKIEKIGEDAKYLWSKLKQMRKDSLRKEGESGLGNIVWKYLRRVDYLDKIWRLSNIVYDKVNSITEGKSNNGNKYTVYVNGKKDEEFSKRNWKRKPKVGKGFYCGGAVFKIEKVTDDAIYTVEESNLRDGKLIREYLEKDNNYPLYHYFKWAKNASTEEKARDLAYQCSWYIGKYIEEIHYRFPEFDEFLDEDGRFEYDDEEKVEEFVKLLSENKLLDHFISLMNGICPCEELPTWMSVDFNRIVKNEWCIHFGNNATEIAKEGFTGGTEEIDRLAYTNAGQEKPTAGFNFAFLITDRSVDYNEYGSEAVIFRTSGVEVYHYGDNQNQVIFWGPNAHDFIPIEYDGWGDWVVKGLNDQVLKKGKPSEIAFWATDNLPQYRKQIMAGKNGYIPKYYDYDKRKAVPYPLYRNESIAKYIKYLNGQQLNEETVADGSSEGNPYKDRWKAEREALKNFICNNGTVMQSKEDNKDGKLYKCFWDKGLSNLIGYNYCLCVQWDEINLKPKSVVYIRACDKFTPNIRRNLQYDTRGMDNQIGTYDDLRYRGMTESKHMISESQESKSISQAKRLVMQRLNYNEQEADEFIRVKLRNDIPVLRTPQGGKFILGVTRMFCDGELRTANDIVRLNSTLKLVASDAHINEYDKNLNGMRCGEIIQRFAKTMSNNLDAEREEIKQMVFDTPSNYKVVRIDSFEQARQYGKYVDWCVTYDEEMFDSYTSNGINQFYFCLRNDFENIKRIASEDCPLDEYGLSMIAVSVDEDGALNTCTCRWNHANDGNDSVMTAKELSQVIGMNFFEVFKPNNKWKSLVSDVIQRLKNGESLESVFDHCSDFSEGFAAVYLNERGNFIDYNTNFLSDKWFDEVHDFKEGFGRVALNDSYNFIDKNGEILSKEWFYWCGDFEDGVAPLESGNEKSNYINRYGKVLSDEWFDMVCDFKNGMAMVNVGEKWNFIDKNGNLLSKRWFDDAMDFKGDYTFVWLDGQRYAINKMGQISRA